MATTPIIIFNDDTDYDAVLVTTKLLYSDAVVKEIDTCGCNNKLCGKLCKTLVYITAADINKQNSDQVRYEEAVEAAYLSINCNC